MLKTTLNDKIIDDVLNDEDFLKALESFIEVYKEKKQKNHNPSIPLSLFADRDLGCLEVTVKYLKENLSLNYSQIAIILNRNQRTIWCTYSKTKIKHKELFVITREEHTIPCEIFLNRTRGPLEALVVYLKENLNLSFKQISKLLNRDYKTIWLSCKKGKET
ncbi:MAG: hypothetical protein ACP5NW_01425 [Candidatus Woesearchaeota archaeon]